MIVFGFDMKKGEIQMRKKVVVALVAAMSLTIAGTGTVFAMDKVSTIASEKEHVHGDNCEWVVDKEAWDETIHHDAVVENQWVVDKEAWTETIEHPAEGHYEEVVIKEAWDEEVTVIKNVCHNCGYVITSQEDAVKHLKENYMNGCQSYGQKEFTEIIHHDAVVENQWVVDKEAWTETIEHPEEGHYEEVVIKEAYDEQVHHPEEGHWVCNGVPQEPEQKPEQPEQPENPEQPEQPENPDQNPEQPENPDVETPETPDAENPETPEQPEEEATNNQPEANKEETQTPATETQKEETAPKTGDTASALPVAGAGVASLGVALATILKKRK